MYVMAFKFLTIVSRHKMNEYAINIPKLNNKQKKQGTVFHMHLTSLKFFVLIPLNQKCYLACIGITREFVWVKRKQVW